MVVDLAVFDGKFNPTRFLPESAGNVSPMLLPVEDELARKIPRRHRKPLPVVVVDTNEQIPWTFDPDLFVTEKRSLRWGDYSIGGMELFVAVERKSLDDFIRTCRFEMERFRKELMALGKYRSAAVAVEATVGDVLNHRYTGETHPHSILGFALAIELDYRVPVHFWGPRPVARFMAERWLYMTWKRIAEGKEYDE